MRSKSTTMLLLAMLLSLLYSLSFAEQTTLISENFYEDEYHKITKSDCVNGFGKQLFMTPLGGNVLWRKNVLGTSYSALTMVVDNSWNRIIYADLFSDWIKSYGTLGPGNDQLYSPEDLDFDKWGNVFIADKGNRRILWLRYDFDNKSFTFKQSIAVAGTNLLKQPKDVTIDDNGTPATDSDDKIWVADEAAARVYWFQKVSGVYIFVGEIDAVAGMHFKSPVSVVIGWEGGSNDGNIYIADKGNNCVALYGTVMDKIWYAPTDASLKTIETDEFGGVWVTDEARNKIYKFNRNLTYLTEIGEYGTGDKQFNGIVNFKLDKISYYNGTTKKSGSACIVDKWTDNSGLQRWVLGADIVDLHGGQFPNNTRNYVRWYYKFTVNGQIHSAVVKNENNVAVAWPSFYTWCDADAYVIDWSDTPKSGRYYLEITFSSVYYNVSTGIYSVDHKTVKSDLVTIQIPEFAGSSFETYDFLARKDAIVSSPNVNNIMARAVTEENGVTPHNGQYMYKYSGTDYGTTENSFAFCDMFYDVINVSLAPEPNYAAKYISFWIYIAESPGAGCISLELVTAKKGAIRDYNYNGWYVVDQFGQRIHPAGRTIPKGKWVNYICDLSVLNPSIYEDDTLRQIQIAYDDGDPSETGNYLAYIDDIVIGAFSYPTTVWGSVEDPTTVKINWTDNNTDEDGFLVWRKIQSENVFTNSPMWVNSVPGSGGKGTNIMSGLTTGASYNFMVRAKRGEQVSAYEWRYGLSTLAAPSKSHNVNANIHVPDGSNDTLPQIEIHNNDVDFNANIYEWERKIGAGGVWGKIKETQSVYLNGYYEAANIIDSTVTFNQDYYYRIRSYNGCGYSEYSTEVQVPVYFRTPTNFSATVEDGNIIVTWQDNSTIETGTIISYKKGDGEWVNRIVGPNMTSYTISNYYLNPLNTYYIKVAQYWNYWDFKQTESTEEIALFIPYKGYTDYNNARRLFRSGDGTIQAAFYNDSLVYHAKSTDNGLDWTVDNPKAYTTTIPYREYSAKGLRPSIGEKRSNNSVYLVRAKQDSLLLDSLGSVTGLNMVIQAGGKRKLNPAIATDSLGSIYCVWAETVLTRETRDGGWFHEYRITDTIKILYSKRSSGIWSTPSVIDPKTIFSTGWLTTLPSPSSYSAIEIPQPNITVNKIGTTLTPHIAWVHQRLGYYQYNLTCDTSAIYYYTTSAGNGIRVSTLDSFAYAPCLGVNSSGQLAITYQQSGDIYRITNNGSAWTTPYNVSNNTGSSQMPTVAYDRGGVIHILWHDNSDAGFTQKISTLPVETDAKLAIAKLTELPPGEESIVWEDSGDVATDTTSLTIGKVSAADALTTAVNATQIFYRRYKDNAWSPIYRLTASEDASVYPALPLTDDPAQMGFLWTEGNAVKYKRLPDLDGPTVALTYPNGGEVLYSGRRYNITWSSADNRGIKSYVLYYTTNYIAQDDPTSTDAVTLWRSVATIVGGLNYYSWRVPYNVTSTNCRFKVVAYDSSGNTATDISDKSFTIKSRDIIVVETDKAIAYNNAGKIARSSDGLLHVCYNSIDSVHYLSSSNDGQTWATSLNLGKGSLPTIVTDSKNMPAMAWIKQWDHDTGGGVFFSRQTATGWSAPETLTYMHGVSWDYIGGYSPPAMTIKNDTISLVFEYSYGGGIPPHIAKGWALHHARFAINNIAGKKDTIIDSYTETIDPPIWQAPASASIATDYKGYDHISWHRKDKVYYRMRKPDGNYGNIMQLSGSGIAQNPCISISGVASAVWVEEGDIYQRTGFDQKWETAVNISASGANSMMPYICGSDVLWTEDVLSDYEVYLSSYSTAKMTYDVSENLSCTDYASIFPHETKLQTNEGTKTYRIWAEEIEPEVLWGLTFMADTTELEPTYALDAGQVEPSIFTVQRDGYITYGTATKAKTTIAEPFKTVDYDTTALIYSFDNFDPGKKYKITLSFYHETGQEIKLKPTVNKLPLGEIKVASDEEAILDKPLPEASYKNGQITLTIEKTKGPIAVCGKILIYENPTGQGHGGAQSEEITSITPNYINKLYQNCPNPFSHKTSFNYQIKNQGQVTFKVYNALGQLVRTLVNETKPAGTYQIEWDGKDGCGRQVSSGVYLYKINAGSFESTKKLIVLK